MKKLNEKECANLIGGWDFTVKIFGWEILDHTASRKGDKWHWWFE
jgi:hypothetical protein